jgi:phenylalanyl-tRNA synthetase beta chain
MKYSFKLGQQSAEEQSNQKIDGILSLSKAELASKLNSQIGAFDEIIDWGSRYDSISVAKVISVKAHPDANKLKVCLVNDGGVAEGVQRDADGLIQVVCGDPDVIEGLITAWVAPGAIVPSTFEDKEPFKLSKIKLRGVESSGMLATAKELNLNNDHESLINLSNHNLPEDQLKVGTPFKQLFNLDDIIVDFENKMFTHRPDCFGHLGVSREVAGIQNIQFKSPDWYKFDTDSSFPKLESELKIEVDNQVPELCPRYMVIPIEGIEVKPSPLWMQSFLTRLGIKPINNVVDVTNYMMVLTGQPMHAFDFDKVKFNDQLAKFTLHKPKKGDQLKVLNGKTLQFDPAVDTILISDHQKVMDLAGMMGGANSEIDKSTKRIVLECANFDMYAIRRSSMKYGIFTDAVTMYTKGQSTAQTEPVIVKAISMLKELIPGLKVGELVDIKKDAFEYDHLTVTVDKVNQVLGLSLTEAEIVEILTSVEIYSHDLGSLDEICVTPPFWRQDLQIEEDVIEEVGRLYGFNKIPASLPERSISPAAPNRMIKLKSVIRQELSKSGANEILTYNFVSEKLLRRANQNPEMAYTIRNALSPELQKYRMAIVPNILEKIHSNIKDSFEQFSLFEIGKAHVKAHLQDDLQTGVPLPTEFQRLGFVSASKNKTYGSTFFVAKRNLTELLNSLGVKFRFIELGPEMFGVNIPITSVYLPGRTAGVEIAGQLRGVIGEFNLDIAKNFKLPESCAGFELDLEILKEEFNLDHDYSPLNKFPSISQDVTIETSGDQSYQLTLDALVHNLELKLNKSTNNTNSPKVNKIKFKIEPKGIYQASDSKTKKVTFSIKFNHPERTLNTDEVAKLLED